MTVIAVTVISVGLKTTQVWFHWTEQEESLTSVAGQARFPSEVDANPHPQIRLAPINNAAIYLFLSPARVKSATLG